jgi:pyruvate/2-oxoglutarate/acetoin dehydrogenase E1 component
MLFSLNIRGINFGERFGETLVVNQGLEGMQEKYSRGELRVTDVGIKSNHYRSKLGIALRGLRPIAEIQYLGIYCMLFR